MLGSHELAEASTELVLQLRRNDPAIDREDCSKPFNETRAIYAIFHFTTGRFYVG